MEITELLEIISRGEDSKHQFKRNVSNATSLAGEMVAFSNSGGGKIFIGVSNSGGITGLSPADINRLNGLVSNVASQNVRPPINPKTENIALSECLVMVITVFDGISKPYMDNQGVIWVKCGADKRKVTSREEMQRMFQSVGLIHGDKIPDNGMTVADLDLLYFKNFFEREYGEKLDNQNVSLPDILKNMKYKKLRIISYTPNKGKANAVKIGINNAKGSHLLFMDADGATAPEEISKMLPELEKYDVVVGSRNLKASQAKKSFSRRILSFGFNTYVSVLFGTRFSDYLCGFNAFRTETAKKLFHNLKSERWIFDVELFHRIKKHKLSCKEIPIHWTHQDDSNMRPIVDTIKIFFQILGLRTRV